MKKTPGTNLYGPVPSRRLGFSLGVDILPHKTCTLDCIYCQLGRSPKKTVLRKHFFQPDKILNQIQKKISSGQRIDHITFSGSGEPTLNLAIGNLIKEIKKITRIPVAVLTNSTTLMRKSVRQALLGADLVVPSLDAASQDVFRAVNRPHASLTIENVIWGLKQFRQEFPGEIWLEIMLVKGVNDSPDHIKGLRTAIEQIQPDKIHLNTVVRPPAEISAQPLSAEDLQSIKVELGSTCEIVSVFDKTGQRSPSKSPKALILDITKRRPVTLRDITSSLGISLEEARESLKKLVEEGLVQSIRHKDQDYYEHK